MSNCTKCGAVILEHANFCMNCGAPIEMSQEKYIEKNNGTIFEETKREEEYAGKIRKCPSCGESLPGFIAICPSCGYEINTDQMPDSVKQFIVKMNRCERAIASETSAKTGWKSWSIFAKFLWILLNVITFCIPLAIYFALSLIRQNRSPHLGRSEQEKASLIKNYTFPNERDAIVNALLFVKAKTSFLAAEKGNTKAAYWMQVWDTKADHLYNKAQLLFPNDSVINSTHEIIKHNNMLIKNASKKRMIIGIVIIFAVILVILLPRFGNIEKSSYSDIDYEVTFEWPDTGLNRYLPEPSTNYGEIDTDDDSRFAIDLYKITQADFEDYVKQCRGNGFTIDVTKTDQVFYAYNEEEFSLDIFYSDDKQTMTLYLDAPLPMEEIHWPKTDLVNQIPKPKSMIGNVRWEESDEFRVFIDNVTAEEYDEYVDECMNAGFTIDYSRGDKTFEAYNEKGNRLVVEKHLFDQMYICIEESDE